MDPLPAISIRSDIAEIPRVSDRLEEAMAASGFSPEDVLDTQLAVEEAITNVIVHGYKNMAGEIVVTFRVAPDHMEVQLADTAPPFDPLSLPEPDLDGNIEDRQVGGLGVYLIRQVMDGISYRYEDGRNVLVLMKKSSQ